MGLGLWLSEEEKSEEVKEEAERTYEKVLEEAPPDFVVNVDDLEVMVRISDLLYEAMRAPDPSKYIKEMERLAGTVIPKERERARKPAKAVKAKKGRRSRGEEKE